MYCILIGGMPAAGKSYLARELSERLGLPMFSKDDIKERLFDTIGFRSRAEKVALSLGAMEALYYAAGQVMARGGSVILENNFEHASASGMKKLLERFGARPLTVMLTGQAEALYSRFVARDQSPERHRGHVVNTCYPEPPGQRTPYVPITLEQYVRGDRERGMSGFNVGGPRVTVDVTDFAQVDLDGLTEQIREYLERE